MLINFKSDAKNIFEAFSLGALGAVPAIGNIHFSMIYSISIYLFKFFFFIFNSISRNIIKFNSIYCTLCIY